VIALKALLIGFERLIKVSCRLYGAKMYNNDEVME
jgi:hypothetical protein